MNIGIDVSMLVYQGSGVASYTYNLVRSLLTYHKNHHYHLFYSSLRKPSHFPYLDALRTLGATVFELPIPTRVWRMLWNQLHVFPVEWITGKVDIFHSSDYLRPPLSSGTRAVTTIHDLTWKKFPQYHTSDVIEAHRRKLEKTVQYQDKIIVDSLNTKNDLLYYYPAIQAENVFVIYPGIDEKFFPIKDKSTIKKILGKYNIKYPKKYLLYVGAIEPRKNLDTAIEIFSKLVAIKEYADFEFLIVGRAGWKNEHIYNTVKTLNLGKKMTFVGFVEDADIPFFYNAASVFVYLSLYEGFGLPPLEAMRCGVPVLMYKNSSLQELVPTNFLFAKPKEELEIIKQLIDKKISVDEDHLNKFTWEKYCAEFLEVIT